MQLTSHDRARHLLTRLSQQLSRGQGVGSMSSSIYDTAWLSMIQTPRGDWLFPECFDFVLDQQMPSGAWESYATPADGILNTAASLLALKLRLQTEPDHVDLLSRCERAELALRRLLDDCDLHATDQVGYEILILSLLDRLKNLHGVSIDFPQQHALRVVRDAKLAQLPKAKVHERPSTLHHSIEAFVGIVDFDLMGSLKEPNGSLMASPAATAAYLMNCSVWDEGAEAYLRKVVSRDNGSGLGGVPCAWPTTIFELSWVVTTFASVGLSLCGPETCAIRNVLEDSLAAHKGLVGFDVDTLPDADDTAKALEALLYLGQNFAVDGLLETFERCEHFATYPDERNFGFTTNCNVLIVLLTRGDRTRYIPQIAKTCQFLIGQVFRGQVREKWHTSRLYWVMLVCRAVDMLFKHAEVALQVLEHVPTLREDIPIVSLHLLTQLLQTQQHDGSWNGICEITSYAVLALSSLARLPWIQQLNRSKIIASLTEAQSYLLQHQADWANGRHLWVEKVTYGSDVLSEAYCIAASFVRPCTTECSAALEIHPAPSCGSVVIHEKSFSAMQKTAALIGKTPLGATLEAWALEAAALQACFAKQRLEREPLDIFPRSAKGPDKYLLVIPLALTVSAALNGDSVSPWVLQEMMALSVLDFHADEYMEGVVERHFAENLDTLREHIKCMFSNGIIDNAARESEMARPHSQERASEPQGHESKDSFSKPSIAGVMVVLRNFVTRVLGHVAVLSSPPHLRAQLAFELQTYLLAHVTGAQDGHRLRAQLYCSPEAATDAFKGENKSENQQPREQLCEPGRTFYHWVRGTSADETSAPFSFVFFNCLIHHTLSPRASGHALGMLRSARAAYLAEDASRHLASLCRMYNDLGSLARDADEGSLNSVNFPEFSFSQGHPGASDSVRSELLQIAEYERQGLQLALTCLEKEVGPGEFMNAMRLFVDVTDLYGQIYVLRDIGTRTK